MRITTIDFISIPGQQKFEGNAEINPIKIKIENDKIQNMFEKYKKTLSNLALKDCFFLSAIKNETDKMFATVGGLMDAKYGLINRKLYQTIGVINLNEIKIGTK